MRTWSKLELLINSNDHEQLQLEINANPNLIHLTDHNDRALHIESVNVDEVG